MILKFSIEIAPSLAEFVTLSAVVRSSRSSVTDMDQRLRPGEVMEVRIVAKPTYAAGLVSSLIQKPIPSESKYLDVEKYPTGSTCTTLNASGSSISNESKESMQWRKIEDPAPNSQALFPSLLSMSQQQAVSVMMGKLTISSSLIKKSEEIFIKGTSIKPNIYKL